ncbi:MAG: pilus assembly protein PilM [Acidobacteria bacterium]|jgi:type IV pilus assembly protein PilM|nr:pilus assembly protein PilM [Acidobacteriota bacterium]
MAAAGGKESLLGLDIGPERVTLCRLRRASDGALEVAALDIEFLPANAASGEMPQDKAALRNALERLMARQGIDAANAAVSLPQSSAFFARKFTLPAQDDDSLVDALHTEALKFLPAEDGEFNFGLGKFDFDYRILARQDSAIEVLLAGDHKKRHHDILDLLPKGLRPVVLDANVFALQPALAANHAVHPGEAVALAAISPAALDLLVIKNGVFQSYFKIHLAAGGQGNAAGLDTLLRRVHEAILRIHAATDKRSIHRLFLSASVPGIASLRRPIEESLGVPVEILNPFAKIRDPRMEAGPDPYLFAIAVGLALRSTRDEGINLLRFSRKFGPAVQSPISTETAGISGLPESASKPEVPLIPTTAKTVPAAEEDAGFDLFAESELSEMGFDSESPPVIAKAGPIDHLLEIEPLPVEEEPFPELKAVPMERPGLIDSRPVEEDPFPELQEVPLDRPVRPGLRQTEEDPFPDLLRIPLDRPTVIGSRPVEENPFPAPQTKFEVRDLLAEFDLPAKDSPQYAPPPASAPFPATGPQTVLEAEKRDDSTSVSERLGEAEVLMKYGFTDKAAELLRQVTGEFPSRISGPEQDNAPKAAKLRPGRQDTVNCSVFAPTGLNAGSVMMVQVFAHLVEQADLVERLALDFDDEARRRGAKTLEGKVAPGARLGFQLFAPGLLVDPPWQTLVWQGKPEAVQFGVQAPADIQPGTVLASLLVSVDSVPVGHIKFKVDVLRPGAAAAARKQLGRARHYTMAFTSYASRDRDQVLARLQMLSLAGIPFFQDILDIDPGDRWQSKLYQKIDQCDLFLLFWSRAARESEWVLKEARYALARKAGDDAAPPEIMPVILEGPPVVEPPQDLAHLHFNDRLIYFMAKR